MLKRRHATLLPSNIKNPEREQPQTLVRHRGMKRLYSLYCCFFFPNLPVNSIPPAPEGKRSLRPAKPASGQRRRGPPAGEPDHAGGGRGSDRGEKWRGGRGDGGVEEEGEGGSAAGYQNALHRRLTHGTSPSCRCLGARMFFQITNKKEKEKKKSAGSEFHFLPRKSSKRRREEGDALGNTSVFGAPLGALKHHFSAHRFSLFFSSLILQAH